MVNKEIIEKRIAQLVNEGCNLKLSSYDKEIDKASKKALQEALQDFFGDSADIKLKIRRKIYILEMAVCDDEVDATLYSLDEYCDKYGEEYREDFED